MMTQNVLTTCFLFYTLWYASDIRLSCLYAYVWTSNVANKMGRSGVNCHPRVCAREKEKERERTCIVLSLLVSDASVTLNML